MLEKKVPLNGSIWIIILLIASSAACALTPGTRAPDSTDLRPEVQAGRPVIVMLVPQTGNRYSAGTAILLQAEARDPEGGIVRIEFYDHFDNVIGMVKASNPAGDPHLIGQISWQTSTEQTHFLKARAFRADDTMSNLAEVSIEIVRLADDVATPAQKTPIATDSGATPGPSASATPNIQLTGVVIDATALNVREGPQVSAGILATLARGDQVTLIGRSTDNQWYAASLQNGVVGWLFATYIEVQGDPTTLPVVSTP